MPLRQLLFRAARLEPLPITMTGVRMGERLLQIGIDDPITIGALAKKVGLSGVNALVASNDAEARRAKSAADAAGVLIDVHVARGTALPFDTAAFDIVVVHAARGLLASMAPEHRVWCLQESRRVLRQGGRIVIIEAAPRGGLAGLFRGRDVDEHYVRAGGAEGALTAEGFKPVRLLGEVEGYKFTEGLKT
jgi:ubiquinone/menaquinone biosynthesis C-methylase UbiE